MVLLCERGLGTRGAVLRTEEVEEMVLAAIDNGRDKRLSLDVERIQDLEGQARTSPSVVSELTILA